jgi:hypothetical protein
MNGKSQTTAQDQAPPVVAVTKQPERSAKAAGPSQVFRMASGSGSQPPSAPDRRNVQNGVNGNTGTLNRARLLRSIQGTVGNSWIGRQFDTASHSQPGRAIQRKCNCGGGGNGGASCGECGGGKVQTLQRQASDSDTDTPSSLPDSVTQAMQSSSGQPLPRSTRDQMESSFGVDFGQARVHTGQQAATAARDIDASAFTVGQDIYFGEGQYQPDSKQGQHLLAHELTHTVQQANGRSALQSDAVVSHPDDPLEREAESVANSFSQDRVVSRQISPGGGAQIHRYSLEELAEDVGAVVDDIEEGAEAVGEAAVGAAEAVGEAVGGAAEAVGEAVSETVDTVTAWIDTVAGQAAIAAAEALAAAFGGSVRIVAGAIEITLPDVTIFDRISHTIPWNDATENIELFQTMFDVPYIGPVFLTIYGRGEASAAVSIGLGPGKLQNMVLTLDPISGFYSGTGQLYAPADVDGSLTLTGVLGAAANWMCLLEVIRIEGGLAVTGSAGLSTELIDTATVTYSSGEFEFDNQLSLDTCLEFGFSLDGLMNIFILEYPIWNGLWNITGATWDKCWPITIGGPEPYQGGGGQSGGGGASGSWGDDEGGEWGGGGATGTYAVGAGNGQTGGGPAPSQSGFTANALLADLFNGAEPDIKIIPLPAKATEKKEIEEACEIKDQEPCDTPLPIRWPVELPLPPQRPPLQRLGSGEFDGDDRGPAQRRLQEQIKEARERGIPPPSPCFSDDAEPNAPYDAHHMQPLFLNGKDQEFNLCALETGRHMDGHASLDDQREMVDSDPVWIACKMKEGRLRFHPQGQMYKIQGRK